MEILSRWRERRAGRPAVSTVDVAESDAAVVEGRPTSLVIVDLPDRAHASGWHTCPVLFFPFPLHRVRQARSRV